MLDGFIARLGSSAGVDLPLMARALWLESAQARALIVGLDLLGLSQETADRIVGQLATDLTLPPGQVILSCSHTHSGPMTVRLRGLGEADEAYLARLEQDVRRASAEAESVKRPVWLAWATAPISVGINRRAFVAGRGIVLGQNPDGPADTMVRLARLEGGSMCADLFVHAVHPYCLGADSNLISPDLFGHAAHHLRGKGHAPLYLNGCAGDIAPKQGFCGPDAAREEGARLAEAVLAAHETARPDEAPDLRVASATVALPYDTMPALEVLEHELDRADRTVRDEERCDPRIVERLRNAGRQWLSELRGAFASGSLPPVLGRVSVVALGRGALVVLPGENFFATGQRIAARLGADPTCVAAYGHGYIGYVPTPVAYAQGGYEVDDAHRYVGWWRLSPQASAILEETAVRLWQQTGGKLL